MLLYLPIHLLGNYAQYLLSYSYTPQLYKTAVNTIAETKLHDQFNDFVDKIDDVYRTAEAEINREFREVSKVRSIQHVYVMLEIFSYL